MSEYLNVTPLEIAQQLRSRMRPVCVLIFGGHTSPKLDWSNRIIEHCATLWADDAVLPSVFRANNSLGNVYPETLTEALRLSPAADIYFFYHENESTASRARRLVSGFADFILGDYIEVPNFLTDDQRKRLAIPLAPAPGYDPDLTDAILVDLDGTLADSSHRPPYGSTPEQIAADKPVPYVVEIIALASRVPVTEIIFVTGRGNTEQEIKASMNWIAANIQPLIPVNSRTLKLLSRTPGDNQPDDCLKLSLYEDYIRGKYNVTLVLDDRPKVVRMWNRLKLPVLAARPYQGEF